MLVLLLLLFLLLLLLLLHILKHGWMHHLYSLASLSQPHGCN
jgi:hypothetical protein